MARASARMLARQMIRIHHIIGGSPLRILVTGVGGFAGSHLADELLKSDGCEVWGALLTPDRPHYLDQRVKVIIANLCSPAEVNDLLKTVRPDRVYHLAGQAFVPQSWTD